MSDDQAKQAALMSIRDRMKGTEGGAQCDRLLAALQQFPVTTFEAMRHLDVYNCPARILQLRKKGHEILTLRHVVQTESGDSHRVGQYLLVRGQ